MLFRSDDVRSVALYPTSDRVAACTFKTLYVCDTATQQLITSGNFSRCHDVAVSNDSKWLAVVSLRTISLYDASTLDRIWSHNRWSSFISFSPDSSQLVSAIYGKASLIDVPTGNVLKSFKHEGVERAVFSHDGTRLLSGESSSVAL